MAGRAIGSEPLRDDSKKSDGTSVYDALRQETAKQAGELPEMIRDNEIHATVPEVGGTVIILQRHGKYIREADDPRVGSLTPESEQDQVVKGREFVEVIMAQLPEDQRDSVDILIVASDTQYKGGGRRSLETATAIQEGMQVALGELGLGTDRIINNTTPMRTLGSELNTGQPRVERRLREPQFFDKSPEYVDFLAEKYGYQTKEFWVAFEGDHEKETREAMGAEGPDEIADRTIASINTYARYAEMYHKSHPGRRLIIWVASHYDVISPLVKRDLAHKDKDHALFVDYGAGISIDIDPNGIANSMISGTLYSVPLKSRK